MSDIKPPTPKMSDSFRIKGYRGIFKMSSKEDNIIYLKNNKTGVKTSLIYGVRHLTKGHLTGQVNPNLKILNET